MARMIKHRWLLQLQCLLLTAGWCVAAPLHLPPLPEAVTSFGAVTSPDGWLYVFGGHKGERHEYNAAKVSGSFRRLRLEAGSSWQELPPAAPSQGVPLVTHGRHIYRLGGMAARNAEGAKQDLHSVALVQRFDPARGSWEDFVALPEPRSSHDAVVLGHKLYVGGGWSLAGGTNRPVWPGHTLMMDLENSSAGWTRIPQPFQRRALALAAQGGRLFFIGGMDSDNQPTLAVEIYDPATKQWAKGPELPPGRHKGFSCSAISQGGRVYANSFQGDLLRLTEDATAWEAVARVKQPRLAHRLVTLGASELLVLGGEDGDGKRPELEPLLPSAVRPVGQRAAMQPSVNSTPAPR